MINNTSTLEMPVDYKNFDESEEGKLVRTAHGLHRIYEVSRDSDNQVIVITGLVFKDNNLHQVNIFPDYLIDSERIILKENVEFNKYMKFLREFQN